MGHLDFWLVAVLPHRLKASLQEISPATGPDLLGALSQLGVS